MSTVLDNPTVPAPAGASAPEAVAERISFEEFLARYSDGSHVEWVDGEVQWLHGEVPEMAAVSLLHDNLDGLLYSTLRFFIEHHQLGVLCRDPVVMKLGPGLPGRAPDIAFVANAHRQRLRPNFIDGPADLVIQIVSPDDPERDYVDNYREYEAAGVPEYWIIDPRLQRTEFNQLQDGKYREVLPDENGFYHSAQLPGLWLKVAWLWQDPLPNLREVLREWKLI